MPGYTGKIWIRARITLEAKNFYREVADLLEWRIPAAEAAGLQFVASLMTPTEFANHILAALGYPPLPDWKEADLELKGE